MTIITLKFSDNLFQGYEVVLDVNYYENLEQLCKQAVTTLKNHLNLHKFELLIPKLEEKDFHIHDLQFGEILLMSQEETVWICAHTDYNHK
jgi:hypothetical protein